jgi:hypothetical protein
VFERARGAAQARWRANAPVCEPAPGVYACAREEEEQRRRVVTRRAGRPQAEKRLRTRGFRACNGSKNFGHG